MKPATDLRSGMVIRLDGDLHREIHAEYHIGGGKMPGSVHAKLRNLRTSNLTERRLRPEERLEDVSLDRQTMEFLYQDADSCTFMSPLTYEQVSLPKESLGPFVRFLKSNQALQVEFLDGSPVEVVYPPSVELEVESTSDPVHAQHDSNVFKSARLENGMEALVPQFIKTGDRVKIDVESGKYLERVK
jgi:elongation factor P